VNSDITIEALKSYLPDQDCDIIWAGLMLSANMPLSSYALKDGATLFAVSRTADSVCFWSRITSDMDWFNDRMRLRSDPILSSENARLKDLRMLRLYEQPGILAKALETMREPRILNLFATKTVVPQQQLTQPMTDQLPMIWAVAKKKSQ
jgi:hypothetical protein